MGQQGWGAAPPPVDGDSIRAAERKSWRSGSHNVNILSAAKPYT